MHRLLLASTALFVFPALASCATPAAASPYYSCNGKLIRKNQPCPAPVPTPAPTPTPTPPPVVSVVSSSVNENAGSVTVHVARAGDLTASSSLSYGEGDVTAINGINYQMTLGGLTFAPGQSDASFSVPIIDDGQVTGNLIFNVLLTNIVGATLGQNGAVTIVNTDVAPPPATQTCPDGSVVAATSVCPAPAPTGWVPSPSLSGLPDIPSNFDIYTALDSGTNAIPADAGPGEPGAFRFICAAGQVLRDDPIVFPGQPGASHLHQFYGSMTANANSTYLSLRSDGASSCQGGIANPANRSGYWMPAMLDGKGHVVQPDYEAIYYKRRPASDPIVSDPTSPQYEGIAASLPNGLRYIFGFNMLNPADTPTGYAYFNCDGPTAVPGHYTDLTQALANCPAGNRVGAIIIAPDCWDGKNLDSPQHREHTAYSTYGDWGYQKCDAQHPYVIPQFQLGAWYSIEAGDDTTLWSLSSDAMYPNLPKGSTLHADWFGAWDNTVLAMWIDNCINKRLSCNGGNLGNGYGLKNAWVPLYMVNGVPTPLWKNPQRLVPIPTL